MVCSRRSVVCLAAFACFCVVATVRTDALAIPLLVVGQAICHDDAHTPLVGCSVRIQFSYTETGGEIVRLEPILTTTGESGAFAAFIADAPLEDAFGEPINPWRVQITVFACGACWSPATVVENMQLGLDLTPVLQGGGFTPGLLDIILAILEGLGAPSIPIILSTDFVAWKAAAIVDVPYLCPEPSTLALLCFGLIYCVGKRRSSSLS